MEYSGNMNILLGADTYSISVMWRHMLDTVGLLTRQEKHTQTGQGEWIKYDNLV